MSKQLISTSFLLLALSLLHRIAIADEHKVINVHNDLRYIATNNLNKEIASSALTTKKHLYGLGMPKGLNKEIVVIDSQVYSSGFEEFQYATQKQHVDAGEQQFDFLVYAHIPRWRDIAVPESVVSFEQFQVFLEKQLQMHNIDTETGSMFQLLTEVEELHWFVVGGMGNLSPDPLSSFLRQKVKGGLNRRAIHAVGAFTQAYAGRATAGQNHVHMHFVTTDELPRFVGHIDNQMRLRRGAVLKLPLIPSQ
ncbi:acetolactate decarboxylase [Glaciecola siphonariae]|uniref:Acetolactate decarboxylase n=1 Tax=Glaciecola siphonariae TaxID=521012 RepID=A0ABV9LXA4_9ALTE